MDTYERIKSQNKLRKNCFRGSRKNQVEKINNRLCSLICMNNEHTDSELHDSQEERLEKLDLDPTVSFGP